MKKYEANAIILTPDTPLRLANKLKKNGITIYNPVMRVAITQIHEI